MKHIFHTIPIPGSVQSACRFVLHFVEMYVAMMLGMLLLDVSLGIIPPAKTALGDNAGVPYQVAMALSMTIPMVGWMEVRGRGWRHGIEMSIGMLLPWAAVLALIGLGAGTALPWLANADGAAMLLGMLAVMLLRPGHYAHAHHNLDQVPSRPSDPVCGMPIDLRTAKRTAEYDGQTFYFCAPGCRKCFLTDPVRFLTPDYAPSM